MIPNPVFIAWHKPLGCTSSRIRDKDSPDVPTVFEVLDLPDMKNFYLIGRLDKDTSGLLLFTTEGRWIPHLISPHSNISKMYQCTLRDDISYLDIQAFTYGPRHCLVSFMRMDI
jgi:16S rRNA pseudouridine516 synthase